MKSKLSSRQYFADLVAQQKDYILEKFENPAIGHEMGAWFLGPKAENAAILKSLINKALDKHIDDRLSLYENDPIYITDELKASEEYQKSIEKLHIESNNLFNLLKGSVPFWSYRWQSHMNWDTTLPSLIGYFSAMLYNPNNVAAEGSPITTVLEMKVGDQLCEMLGYNVEEENTSIPRAWGHITCDGSIANNEAMWAARNIKYFVFSLRKAIAEQPSLKALESLMVKLCNGSYKAISELSDWELINIKIDDALGLPEQIEKEFGIPIDTLTEILNEYSIQNIGFNGLTAQLDKNIKSPIIIAPSHIHYSWPKSAAVLGIGANHVKRIPLDLDARMDINALEAAIIAAKESQTPIAMVVVIIGSTETSAVDSLKKVILLREKYNAQGIDFSIHCDAAWGGYFAAILRPGTSSEDKSKNKNTELPFPKYSMFSEYVSKQYEYLHLADSITVDPHKAGFIPYPAGGLCYRNGALRNIVSFTAPVVYHGGIDATVGVYGMEGSKPGAAAAAAFLSHTVIPLNQDGYGKILSQCIFNGKRTYCEFLTMAEADDEFIIKTVQRLPSERQQKSSAAIEKEYLKIKEEINPLSNAAIYANPEYMHLFSELGGDQAITSYAFNFKHEGKINTNIDLINELNFEIFKQLSLSVSRTNLQEVPLIITQSQFDIPSYGKIFVNDFKKRLGIIDPEDKAINFLITTTTNPWISDTAIGNFIPTIKEILRTTVISEIKKLKIRHGLI